MSTTHARLEPVLASEDEGKQAVQAAQAIGQYMDTGEGRRIVSLKLGDHRDEACVPLPASATKLLLDVLTHFADGNAVMVLPIHREISTQQAADLLNISRPYLVRMLERDELPYRQVGTRRRLQLKDVLAYKARQAADRKRVLDELTAQAEELGLY